MKTLCLLFLVISLSAYSQENRQTKKGQNNSAVTTALLSSSYPETPRIIPPSPEVSSIFKFINYPVNHSTGLVKISIPLYTITCGDLTLPISIDYHANGRMYNDITGAIGLGWTLNAGGTISRTVYGYPDEKKAVSPFLKESSNLYIKNDFKYLAGIYYDSSESLGQSMDGEYDLFSYYLPGMSGSFVIYDGSPMSLTLNAVRIAKINGSGYLDFNFSITGEDGTVYIFGDAESSTAFSPYANTSSSANTAWYLKEMRSADGKHVIRFTYAYTTLFPGDTSTSTLANENMIINDMIAGNYQYQISSAPDYKTSAMRMTYKPKRLKEINFGTGKVEFDIEQVGGKVKTIKIKDANDKAIKIFELSHSFLDRAAVDNYKLDKINCLSSTSATDKSDIYQFEYYPTSTSFDAKQCDYWGYINNNQLSFFIPEIQIYSNKYLTYVGHQGVNREPDENKKKSGILKKITYPTGSSTEYMYENNKYYAGSTAKDGPGLRIKQIKTIDDFNKIQLRTFEYGNYGVGSLIMVPDIRYWGYETIFLDVKGSTSAPSTCSYDGHYRQRIFSSEAPQDASYYAGQPVFYSTATEYKGDQSNNTGKIVYNFMNPNDDSYVYNIPSASYPSSYPSYYPYNMPKSFFFEGSSYNYRYTSQFGSLWKERNLSSQYEYLNTNGTYSLVKSTEYNYERKTAAPLHGLKVFKYIQVKDDYSRAIEEFIATDYGLPVFLFASYYITRGRELLTSVTEREIRQNNIISTTRSLDYASNYLQRSNTITNSSGLNLGCSI